MPDNCGAKTRQGGQCGKQAGWGTDHGGVGRCKLHGGSTPPHQLSGAVQLARREAMVMGQVLDIDPREAIVECIRIAAGEVQYCSTRIWELEDIDAMGPATTIRVVDSVAVDDDDQELGVREIERATTTAGAVLHRWIQARHTAMDRLVTYSKIALAAGIEERRVQLAEQHAQLIAQAIKGIIKDLGIEDTPEVMGLVRRHLTLVAGGIAA